MFHSSDYNLFQICPNILVNSDRSIKYIDSVYSFNTSLPLKSFSIILDKEEKLASFVAHISYLIIESVLINRKVIKKDIEDYFNSQILSFIKINKMLGYFELKQLAGSWKSVNNTIDFFIKNIKSNYHNILTNHTIYWSDDNHNYHDNVPLIGISNDNSVDIFLILQSDLGKDPLYSHPIDYLKVPHISRILYWFINQQITINSLKVIWINNKSLNYKFKLSSYDNISNKEEVLDYIHKSVDIRNYRVFNYSKPNISNCKYCPYLEKCRSKEVFFKTDTDVKEIEDNIISKTSKENEL